MQSMTASPAAVALQTSGVTRSAFSWPRLNDLSQQRLEALRDHPGAS